MQLLISFRTLLQRRGGPIVSLPNQDLQMWIMLGEHDLTKFSKGEKFRVGNVADAEILLQIAWQSGEILGAKRCDSFVFWVNVSVGAFCGKEIQKKFNNFID